MKANILDFQIKCKSLSDREWQILFLIANGKTVSAIASLMFLSPNTIKAAISVILRKLKVQNRAEAVYLITQYGFFECNKLLFDGFVNEI